MVVRRGCKPTTHQRWLPSTTVVAAQTLLFFCSSSVSQTHAWTLSDLLDRPFIQRALVEEPKTAQSVLSFFYGVDYENPEDIDENLVNGGCIDKMTNLWFFGEKDYDSICTTHFAQAVRQDGDGASATTENQDNDMWTDTVDGVMARLILCDQISRNAFRGTTEAFAFDGAALECADTLSQHILALKQQENKENNKQLVLKGTVYPPYISSVVTALMHSEVLQDHENGVEILQYAKETSPPSLSDWWVGQEQFLLDHKHVVERFGRYPHRNKLKGRTSTSEEVAWLEDTENLPGWAKSQG